MKRRGMRPEATAGRGLLGALLALTLLPASAHAHASIQGLGDFLGGLLHPVVTPSHVLLLVGLGLLAGRTAPPPLRWPMRCFLPLSAAALAVTGCGGVRSLHPAVLHGTLLVVGVLLAWGRDLSAGTLGGLFAFTAAALGLDSAPETTVPSALAKALAGTWLGLAVVVYDVAIYVSLGAHTGWLRNATRIAGAWLAAIAVLLLAFALRGGLPGGGTGPG